ncbi:MAG: tRNA (N(6)-L-threonylcarbamoyladenosine(37)-C(2))-methylthiotransferase MtaB [Ignavibacteriaceae bacterium]|nr:tRNA (N(6)-L-threonylcarbamoyladenosine(37)-C(2))-methylthiotransferase MtaB [Ignavibacteriaceae bacterium]
MNKKVALHTLGCKLNFSETAAIGKQFITRGFSIVEFSDHADVYVLNTCSVTENAEKECRQVIRRSLRINPDAFVIVTGCYAQLRPEEISRIDGVDAVLGSNEKFDLFSYLNDFEKKELTCIYTSTKNELDHSFGFASSTDIDSRTRAYFKIQDGCDYKCTYCTIPLARGASRSLEPEKVLEQFRLIVAQGYKEIILTGVNVGDYGKSFAIDFYHLLKKLVSVEGDFRIRISSIEPNLLTDEIISLTLSTEKICKHFHIPLQSGSDKILRLMQRRYTTEDYKTLITKLNKLDPEIGIGVDVITGFPGETEEDFQETYNFLRDLPISYLHVFTYSERPDTKAISLPDKVETAERKRRSTLLRILSDKKRFAFHEKFIGKKERVLFEEADDNGIIKGFTSNYIRVFHPFDNLLQNEFCLVTINKVFGNYCNASIEGENFSVERLAV